MERRKKYKTVKVCTAVYTVLYSEKVKRNAGWDELISSLIKEKERRIEPKTYFNIKISDKLYERLKKLKERYGLTWDELFMYLIL